MIQELLDLGVRASVQGSFYNMWTLKELKEKESPNLLKERPVGDFNIYGPAKAPKFLIYAERQRF